MPQFPVIGYQLQVSTAPPATPNAPPIDFVPRVVITIQAANGQQTRQLQINNPAEFMALCAVIQAPGRLVFDLAQETLEKVMP